MRGNHASFITKDLRMPSTQEVDQQKKPKQMKNIFEINEKLYRKQRNKCFNQEKIDKTMFF